MADSDLASTLAGVAMMIQSSKKGFFDECDCVERGKEGLRGESAGGLFNVVQIRLIWDVSAWQVRDGGAR